MTSRRAPCPQHVLLIPGEVPVRCAPFAAPSALLQPRQDRNQSLQDNGLMSVRRVMGAPAHFLTGHLAKHRKHNIS